MADNLQLNEGTGGGILATASLTISGDTANVQRIACGILSGSEGSWTYTTHPGGAGAVDAGTPRVTLANDDPAVALLTTIDADTGAMATDLAAIEVLLGTIDADTGAIAASAASIDGKIVACNTGAVVISSGSVSVSNTVAVSGTFWQATQPVSAVSLPLPTGASTLAEQQTQTTAIGNAVTALQVVDDWDESDRAAVNVIVGQAGIAAGAGAVGATVPRVTLASDDPAVARLTTIDEDTGTISSVISTLNGKVTACNTGAVVVSSGTITTVSAVTAITNALPAGTNAIGKLAANSGVDIGDVDVASIAAGTNTIGGVIAQASTSAAYDGTTSCTIKRLSGIATASGANTILAAVADKKFRVLALSLIATSTTAVVLYVYNGDYNLLGDGTNKITLDMDGGGGPAGLVLPYNAGGWFQTDTANEALAINLGAATPVIWAITYIEVA